MSRLRNPARLLCMLAALLALVWLVAGAQAPPEPQPDAPPPRGDRSDQAEAGEVPDPVDDQAARRQQWLQETGLSVVIVQADGEVDNFMRDSIISRIGTARDLGADVVILQLDTYGGLVTAGLEISRYLKQQGDLRILCFVDEKAISAGAMIAMACDAIAMEPATTIGDAGVIAMGPGGAQGLDETMRAKVESPVVVDFVDSAERNGYSPLLAEAFVRFDHAVHYIQNTDTGERRFVNAQQYDQLTGGGAFGAEETDWEPVSGVPNPLVDARSLLTLTDVTAERIGLSIGTFDSPQGLSETLGWTVLATLSPSPGERLVGFLSNYAVRGALIMVLFLGIYMSLSHPGTGLPEVISALCLAVLFGVPLLTGFATWYEVVLVLLGVLFLAIELFLIPGFGFAGITGLILIIAGLAMTFVPPIALPGLPVGFGVEWSRLGYGLLTVVAGLACSLLLWFWLSRYLPKLPYAHRLILQDEPVAPDEAVRRAAEIWPLPGTIGLAVSDLRPGGTAKFAINPADPDDTANADVVSDRGFIPAGSPLAVVEVAGNRVVVRPVQANDEQRAS